MSEPVATPSVNVLEVEHLSMKFGGLVAIGDLSFEVRRGEITALIGPNGAGKTTVFNCITGFYKPSEGMIRMTRRGGEQFLLERMPDFQIPAKAKVARTFQNIRLFAGMTVLENLLVAQHNKLMEASGFTILGLLGIGRYAKASEESIETAKFWLDKADLTERADDPAGDLPYGAQRRLEIARAMCTGPELLCLDEPAAGLNPRESAALNHLLMSIKNDTGTSILLIEHDMSVVMKISDHVVVLEYGRKISDGDPGSVKNDPRVIAAYLGVDDEEVQDVLIAVGDEHVIHELDAEPDPAHGPNSSSSMLAGPISDTIGHSNGHGELVKVSPSASKADQADAKAKRTASVTKSDRSAKAGPADRKIPTSPVSLMSVPKVSAPKPAAPKAAASKTAGALPPAGKAPVKPAEASKPKTVVAKAGSRAVAAPKSVAVAPGASTGTKPVSVAPSTAKPAARSATKAAAKPAPSSAPKAVARKATAAVAKSPELIAPPDDLTRIKGIGPVNDRKLREHGITRFDQIAGWKKADVTAVEAYLEFDGRIAREDWIGQARKLARAAPAAKRGVKK